MRAILILGLLLSSGCTIHGTVSPDDVEVFGSWIAISAERGSISNGPSTLYFAAEGIAEIAGRNINFQAQKPYLIVWGTDPGAEQLPEAIYYEVVDGQLRLITDVGTFVYERTEIAIDDPAP